MINVASVFSLRNLPQLVEYGYSLIFYMIWASVLFFIPSALVSAELASTWPHKGGIFLWVKKAFGARWGTIAIFMQWTANIPWLPAILTFMASSVAYVINPSLATNKTFTIAVIWGAIWLATAINFYSIKSSSYFISSGVVLGTIIPSFLLILLGLTHFFSDKNLAIEFSAQSLMPQFNNFNHLMFFIGVLVSITGIEMSSAHIKEIEKPKKKFCKSHIYSMFYHYIIIYYWRLIYCNSDSKRSIKP